MAMAEVQRVGEPVRRWARTQKEGYTRGEARPLGADLGAVGDALLLTIGTFRLARRIAKDPVTAPVRAPFVSYQGTSGEAEVAEEVREHGGVKHAVGELLTCPFCMAQWVGTGFVLGYVTAPRATRLAALTMTMVAGSDVLQFAYDAIQDGGRPTGTEGVDEPG